MQNVPRLIGEAERALARGDLEGAETYVGMALAQMSDPNEGT